MFIIMIINDDAIDIISLGFILGGLALLFFFVLDFNYDDAALEWKESEKAELSGKISSKTDFYYFVYVCRSFKVYSEDFYDENYEEGDEIRFIGSLSNGIFYADSSERKI